MFRYVSEISDRYLFHWSIKSTLQSTGRRQKIATLKKSYFYNYLSLPGSGTALLVEGWSSNCSHSIYHKTQWRRSERAQKTKDLFCLAGLGNCKLHNFSPPASGPAADRKIAWLHSMMFFGRPHLAADINEQQAACPPWTPCISLASDMHTAAQILPSAVAIYSISA